MSDDTDLTDPDVWKIARYVAEITLYDRETEKWRNQIKKILLRYKDQRNDSPIDNSSRYNVLWSNTQTLQPALYARNPKPDIQRRFKDADPVGRITSTVLERSVDYFTSTDLFGSSMRQCVVDYLLPGRGTTWLRYVPHMRKVPAEVTNSEEGDNEPLEVIDYEEVVVDYVACEDFGHNICRTWDEVWMGYRIVYMDRAELVKRFKERGNEVPLDYTAKDLHGQKLDGSTDKAIIYELWDKKRGIAVWFHKKLERALDVRLDPLKLDGFFPFPKPILTNLCNDSLIPTPMYVEYQDQALELDALTARITSITKSIKVAGVRDASAQGLERLLSEGQDNVLLPVESWAMFAQNGGIDGAISWLPLEPIAKALLALYQAREQVKKDLREISGIPDIVRGDSNPNETLGAQQIKVSFATNRISDMQRDIQRFVRENVRIMVDIICNHFQLETIKQISGVRLLTAQEKDMGRQMIQQAQQTGQPPPLPPGIDPDMAEQLMSDPTWEEVQALIKNNALRCFRIDIETDSTIKADEEADKASRIEFLKAVGMFLQQAVEAGQQQPEMVPVLGQMLMFGIRGFPVGKELEGSFETALKKLEKQAQNPQPKPDPKMMELQGNMQIAQAKLQSEQQMEQARMQAEREKLQGEQALEAQRIQGQIQLQQAQADGDVQARIAELQQKKELAQYEMQMRQEQDRFATQQDINMQQAKLRSEYDLAIIKANIAKEQAIEVARINAKATSGEGEEQQAQADVQDAGGSSNKVADIHAKIDGLASKIDQATQKHSQDMTQLAAIHNQSMQALHKAIQTKR